MAWQFQLPTSLEMATVIVKVLIELFVLVLELWNYKKESS